MTTKITNDNIVSVDASKVTNLADSFDDNDIVNDLSTLALRQASNENKAAYNTSSMYIDVFQDSTGITALTDTLRNASEYMSSANPGDATDFAVTFSGSGSGNNGLRFPGSAGMVLTGDFTIEWFQKTNTSQAATSAVYGTTNEAVWTASAFHVGYLSDSIIFGRNTNFNTATFPFSSTGHDNEWHHLAFVRQSGTLRAYLDGVASSTTSTDSTTLGNASYRIIIGAQEPSGTQNFIGTIDNFAINGTCKYPDGTSFTTSPTRFNGNQFTHHFDSSTPGFVSGTTDYRGGNGLATVIGNVSTFGTVPGRLNVVTTNATGSFTSNNITSSSAITSMGAIITYEDNAGTNALNTDIILKLSADGGSNYATATLVAMPDFSSGIKMAKVNDLAVTSGTALKYKVEFANQAASSKEARIRGVSLQY
jgi:hypothetical protein